MANFAEEFAENLPDPDFSIQTARQDATRVKFDDRDCGWPGMLDDLPPRLSQKDKRVMLKKRKLLKEAGNGAIAVEDTDVDLSQNEETDLEEPERHSRSQEYGLYLR